MPSRHLFRHIARYLPIQLAVILVASLALAADAVPVPLRAAILTRSAGYEAGLRARTGDVVLAVVVGPSEELALDGREMLVAFKNLASKAKIGSRRMDVVTITHQSATKTASDLRMARAEVVYFSRGLESIIRSVPAREGDVARILVCARGQDVGSGCTLGVELAGNKPRLVLHLKQANQSGLRFNTEFLRLVRIVR